MREVIVALSFAVAITLVAVYVPLILNPFDEQALSQYTLENEVETRDELRRNVNNLILSGDAAELINEQNLFIVVTLFLVSIGAWVFFVQILIYRLLQRRFAGGREYIVAGRRAVWVVLIIASFIYYRFNIFPDYMYLITPLLFLIVEYLITRMSNTIVVSSVSE